MISQGGDRPRHPAVKALVSGALSKFRVVTLFMTTLGPKYIVRQSL